MSTIKTNTLGVMIDCSRNSVMNVLSLKKFIKILSEFGYNMLQLYTEDTVEVAGEPYFGYMRGHYSEEEIKDIDSYAASLNVELVPCIQTLAHLNAITRWNEYKGIIDCNDILLVEEKRTYVLIENIFSSLAAKFSSRNVNIGMDEAAMVGLGKYLHKHGYKDRYGLLLRHLEKVCGIAAKYGFKPMMWSDMFFRLNNNGEYYVGDYNAGEETINAVPEKVSLIYWDYYSEDKSHYDKMLKNHAQFKKDIWFAGGIWSWTGFAPHNEYSMRSTKASMQACIENGIKNIFFTMWGDNGGECSYFSLLPSLFYAAECSRGVFDEDIIKNKFKAVTGEDFDTLLAFDLPDKIDECVKFQNPSKYMLYSDPFTGVFDCTVKENDGLKYKSYSSILKKAGKKSNYKYIFDFLGELCNCLAVKYELGVKTRAAYVANEFKQTELLIGRYDVLIKNLNVFYDRFKELWFKENKAFGFEVHEIRLGGLIMRTKSCRQRLKSFLDNGQKIEELEEEVLDILNGEEKRTICYNNHLESASVNIF